MVVTRNYLVWALENNIKTKNYLLYWYFQELIDSSLTSSLVQKKISDDLGHAIKKSQIETIRYRIPTAKLQAFKTLISIEKATGHLPKTIISENKAEFTNPFEKNNTDDSFIKLIS
ncbi:MAG: hypothetical protein ACOVO2_02525 [Emticicia sp.]|uniref:hypothetical protein n=1 Tax=Emticicia sp. TaxID=1930953 RepID=UPI003BA83400